MIRMTSKIHFEMKECIVFILIKSNLNQFFFLTIFYSLGKLYFLFFDESLCR